MHQQFEPRSAPAATRREVAPMSAAAAPRALPMSRRRMSTLNSVRLALFAAPALISALLAQSGSAVIGGSVKDAAGAVIPAATVKLTNRDTGASFETLTNEAGLYRIASLLPGSYKLFAEAPGFDPLERSNITLQVSQVLAVDLTLQVGRHSEVIQVEDAAPLAETQTSNVTQLVNRKMVEGLALPNRAASSLVALAPGVVLVDDGRGTAENYPVFSVAGGRVRNQSFTLDGGNVTNAVGLTRPQQLTSLPMDAMQEFRVISNSYAAEHGHSAGGVITMSTRSGTNTLHWSLFEFLRNDAFDGRNFFAAQRTPIKLHQYGGTVGGPIRKDRTHFFASWEQTRQVTSSTVLQTVPDQRQRAGDFSGLVDSQGRAITIYDPATTVGRERQPFAGNQIPASRFDPIAGNALSYWPLPNRAATATGSSNYAASNSSSLNRDIFVAKVDHQFRPSDQLSMRYYVNDSEIANRGAFGIPESDPDAVLQNARIQSALGSHTHTFRPNLINEFRATYLRRRFIDGRYGAGEDLAGKLGLKGVSKAGFPTFVLPGYTGLGGLTNVSRTQTPIEDTQIQNATSYYQGRHAWKIGVEHRRGANNEIRDRSSSGNFAITPLITSKPGAPGTGNSVASFVLGEVSSASVLVSDKIRSRAEYWAWYVQDDWRVTDRLTLNLGLRWETELPRREVDDKQNQFDTAAINPLSGTPGIVTFSGRDGVPHRAFHTDWNNFGPRIGFAYQLPSARTTVIRGGVGIFYGPTVSNTIGDTAATGFSTSASLVAPQADLLSAMRLREGFPEITRPPLDSRFGAVLPGERPNTSVGFFEQHRRAPISYQYNLNIQRELARDLLVEIGYLGNVSHRLTANDLSLNQVLPELMGPGDAQRRRPFPQFSNVYWINPAVGNSSYHGGFLKAEKRFSRGLSFLTHYTFSRFIDDVASSNEYGDPQSYMDAYNRGLDKALSGTDVPHRLVASVLYETPSFPSKPLVRGVLGRWKLGAFTTVQSGAPFTVVMTTNTTNAFSAGPLRPNLARRADLSSSERSLARWFDTSAFAAPASFTFGNSPRSGLRGASQRTVDFTATKEFALSERLRLDLRGEAYNLLNTANFDVPGHAFGAADFGVVASSRPARAIQFGVRMSY